MAFYQIRFCCYCCTQNTHHTVSAFRKRTTTTLPEPLKIYYPTVCVRERHSKLPIQVYYGTLFHQFIDSIKFYLNPLNIQSDDFSPLLYALSLSRNEKYFHVLKVLIHGIVSAGLNVYQHKYIHLYKILLQYSFITLLTIYYIHQHFPAENEQKWKSKGNDHHHHSPHFD